MDIYVPATVKKNNKTNGYIGNMLNWEEGSLYYNVKDSKSYHMILSFVLLSVLVNIWRFYNLLKK